mgnify:CR=1 FL=1
MTGLVEIGWEPAQRLAFTAAADSEGNPLVLHHGTVHRFREFADTVDLGFHFGTREQAARRLDTMPSSALRGGERRNARIVSAALAVNRPFLLLDDPGTWQPGHLGNVIARLLGREPMKHATLLEIRGWLSDAGYDAVCYRNMYESSTGSRSLEFSWAVFSPHQVVILGEDVKAGAVRIPDGMKRAGFDPHAEARRLGGLRFKSGRLQAAADRRAFRAAFSSAMAKMHPDVVPQDYCGVATQWIVEAGEASVRILLHDDLGEVRVGVNGAGGHDALEDVLHGVTHDGSTYGLAPSIRTEFPMFWCEWTPGEPVDAAVRRSAEMVDDVMRRMAPEAAPAP